MNPEPTSHFCFITWVTHNSRVSERMVDFLPAEYIENMSPVILNYARQIRIAELIEQCSSKYNISIITFNVLPDHVHMLVRVTDESDIPKQIGSLKGYTAYVLRKELNIETSIWARKYNAQWIKDDQHLENVIFYIDHNHEKHLDSWGKDQLCGYGDELRAIVEKVAKSST